MTLSYLQPVAICHVRACDQAEFPKGRKTTATAEFSRWTGDTRRKNGAIFWFGHLQKVKELLLHETVWPRELSPYSVNSEIVPHASISVQTSGIFAHKPMSDPGRRAVPDEDTLPETSWLPYLLSPSWPGPVLSCPVLAADATPPYPSLSPQTHTHTHKQLIPSHTRAV